ncbi:hypothetical protein RB595_006846 [Gaeumannomyces hyphopodioides]
MSTPQSSNNSPTLDHSHTPDTSPERNRLSAMNLVWTDSESESEDLSPSSPSQAKSLLWMGAKNYNTGMLGVWNGNPVSDADGKAHKKITTIQDVGGKEIQMIKNTTTTSPHSRTASPFGSVRPNGYMAPFLPRSAACLSLQDLYESSSSLLDAAQPSTYKPATWPVPALQYMPTSALRPNTPSPIKSSYRENWDMAPPVLPRSAFPSMSPENSPSSRPHGLPHNAPKPATWHQPTLRGGGSPSEVPKPTTMSPQSGTHSASPVELSDMAKSSDLVELPDSSELSGRISPPDMEKPLTKEQQFIESVKQGILPPDWREQFVELFSIDVPTMDAPPPSPRPRHATPISAEKSSSSIPPQLPRQTSWSPINLSPGHEQLPLEPTFHERTLNKRARTPSPLLPSMAPTTMALPPRLGSVSPDRSRLSSWHMPPPYLPRSALPRSSPSREQTLWRLARSPSPVAPIPEEEGTPTPYPSRSSSPDGFKKPKKSRWDVRPGDAY